MDLAARTHWIFDLDGTLTVAVHDFDAIRAALDLPAGAAILETLAAMDPAEAAPRYARLDAIETALARRALPQEGAIALLETLRRRGARLGLITRNSERSARATLRGCGFSDFFAPGAVIAREAAAPKPSPAGIRRLLERWAVPPEDAVMVGDYYFDLAAGRGAGVATVYLDVAGEFPWAAHADRCVQGLGELHALVADPQATSEKAPGAP